jgi:hypothetical protein
VRQVKSIVKSMLIIFLDIKEIFRKEFTLAGQTVNSTYYCMKICKDFALNFGNIRTDSCIKTVHRLTSFPTMKSVTKNNKTLCACVCVGARTHVSMYVIMISTKKYFYGCFHFSRPCFQVFCLVIYWKATSLAKSTFQHGWEGIHVEISSSDFYKIFTDI